MTWIDNGNFHYNLPSCCPMIKDIIFTVNQVIYLLELVIPALYTHLAQGSP